MPYTSPFVYPEVKAPLTGTITDIMQRAGDPYARAAMVSGQAWGQAAQNIGQDVSGAIQQVNDPRRQREQQEVEANKRTQMYTGAVNQMVSNLMQTNPDGTRTLDRAKLQQQMAAGNVPLPVQQQTLKALDDVDTSVQKFTQQRIDHTADLAHGAITMIDAGMDPHTAVAGALAYGKANGITRDQDMDQIAGHVATLDGPGVKQFLLGVRGLSEKYKEMSKPVVLPAGRPGAPPPAIIEPSTGRTIAGGGEPTPEKPTEASLASAAAGGDPAKALELLHAQKNPPSLEEQYYSALAKGDQATAATIRKTWQDKATASRDQVALAQIAATRELTQQEAQARLDDRDVASDKNQAKFEQQYRTVLQRGLSSRSGGLGLEDAKVQQANHLLALLDQTYDAKTDTYTIPKMLQGELAAGLARLVAPGGQVGIEMMREFNQRTAKGDLAGALTYVTGHPFPTATQDIAKMLKDSIERQGHVALDNREGEMAYLRGLAPTELNEDRRQQLEARSLNPLRQSRIATNAKGERRLFVSTDGGQTWK